MVLEGFVLKATQIHAQWKHTHDKLLFCLLCNLHDLPWICLKWRAFDASWTPRNRVFEYATFSSNFQFCVLFLIPGLLFKLHGKSSSKEKKKTSFQDFPFNKRLTVLKRNWSISENCRCFAKQGIRSRSGKENLFSIPIPKHSTKINVRI